MNKTNRIYLLDTIRGMLIVLVVIYHILFDINTLFGVRLSFMNTAGMNLFRDGFVSILILIAGISCNLSRNNLRRGLKTIACGILISAVTFIFMPDQFIIFGILHFMGTAMIFFALTEPFLRKIGLVSGTVLMLLLFLITWNLAGGVIGIGNLGIRFHMGTDNIGMFILGFPSTYFSGDYYPVMPWIFCFLSGSFVGRLFKSRRIPAVFFKNFCPPLSWLGRHTLIIYLLHQPLVYGILFVVFQIFE